MFLKDLSRADALAYRDSVLAREQTRLAELAGWLEATGSPVEEMDASLASLEVLWPWCIRFAEAGYPGIPLSAGASWWGDERPTDSGPRLYFGEALGHYVLLVIRRVDPGVSWQVETNRRMTDYHKTGVRFSDGTFWPLTPLALLVERAVGGDPRWVSRREPGALRQWVENLVRPVRGVVLPTDEQQNRDHAGGQGEQPVGQWGPGAGGCVLPPPQVTPDPPRVWWRPTQQEPGTPQAAEEPMSPERARLAALVGAAQDLHVFRGPDVGLADPHRLGRLPRRAVQQLLTGLGMVPQGEPETIAPGFHTQDHVIIDRVGEGGVPFPVTLSVVSGRGSPRLVSAVFDGDLGQYPAPQVADALLTLAARTRARAINSDHADIED